MLPPIFSVIHMTLLNVIMDIDFAYTVVPLDE